MIARILLGAILIGFGGVEVAAAAETFRDCSVCPVMVKLSPGSFLMGTAAAASDSETNSERSTDDEQPQHSVTFKKPFALGKYPVTRREFAAFVRETHHDPRGCFLPPPSNDVPKVVLTQGLSWRNPGFAQTERDPVVCLSFDDATRYARWLSRKTGKSYRLPSESEWEYAARAGTKIQRYWSGGNARACHFANVLDLAAAKAFKIDKSDNAFFPCYDGYIYTAPVGSFPPNAFGLYDMLGNVYQWTADCYTSDYKRQPDDENGKCYKRVLRGGSYANSPFEVRSAYRHGLEQSNRDIFSGIRMAVSYDLASHRHKSKFHRRHSACNIRDCFSGAFQPQRCRYVSCRNAASGRFSTARSGAG